MDVVTSALSLPLLCWHSDTPHHSLPATIDFGLTREELCSTRRGIRDDSAIQRRIRRILQHKERGIRQFCNTAKKSEDSATQGERNQTILQYGEGIGAFCNTRREESDNSAIQRRNQRILQHKKRNQRRFCNTAKKSEDFATQQEESDDSEIQRRNRRILQHKEREIRQLCNTEKESEDSATE